MNKPTAPPHSLGRGEAIKIKLLSLLAFAILLAAPQAQAQLLTTISNNFQAASSGWMTTAQGYAQSLFSKLVVLDLAWWTIKSVLKKNDLADWLSSFVLKIIGILFFWVLITEAPTWVPYVTQSFMQIGQAFSVAGSTAGASLTPTGIMNFGISVASAFSTMIDKSTSGASWAQSFVLGLAGVASAICILIGYALVAMQLLVTLIEMYLVCGVGLVMLGFTGTAMTTSSGEKYLGYVLSIGVKLMVIYAIAGLGSSLATQASSLFASLTAPTWVDILALSPTFLIYGAVALMVPGLASSLMNGSPGMTLGSVGGAAAGVAAVGVGAAVATAGMAQMGLEGADKFRNAVGAGGGASSPGADPAMASLAKLSSGVNAAASSGGSSANWGGGGTTHSSPVPGLATYSPAPTSASGAAVPGPFGSPDTGSLDTSPVDSSVTGGSATGSETGALQSAMNDLPQPPAGPGVASADSISGAPAPAFNANLLDAKKETSIGKPYLQAGLGSVASARDTINRHEGGGGGISIRLDHNES